MWIWCLTFFFSFFELFSFIKAVQHVKSEHGRARSNASVSHATGNNNNTKTSGVHIFYFESRLSRFSILKLNFSPTKNHIKCGFFFSSRRNIVLLNWMHFPFLIHLKCSIINRNVIFAITLFVFSLHFWLRFFFHRVFFFCFFVFSSWTHKHTHMPPSLISSVLMLNI